MKGGWFWHELNTPNGSRAKHFYEALLGWGAADMPMPTGMYTVFQHSGTGHGGMIQTGGPGLENIPPMWLTYIESDDVDGDHRRVGDLGGKAVTHVMEVPNVGRWFLAEDPTGAQFALMQPFPQPAAAAPEPAKAKASKPAAKKPAARKPAPRKPAKGKTAAKRAKALVPKVAKAKAAAAKPPSKTASKKAHPRSAALKAAKRPKSQRPGKMAARDTAAAKRRAASLKGRSQLNFRR